MIMRKIKFRGKEEQERLKRHMENFRNNMTNVAACAVTAEDIVRASKEILDLARE